MDHDVEDDVDVGAALRERCEALALDEARLRDEPLDSADRRVEALEMADLEHALAADGELEQLLAVGDRRRGGCSTRTSMPASRSSRATAWWYCVFTATLTQSTRPRRLPLVDERLGADLGGDGAAAVAVDVDDGDEIDVGMGGVLERVEAPEIATPTTATRSFVPRPPGPGRRPRPRSSPRPPARASAPGRGRSSARLDRERTAAHLGERPDRLGPIAGRSKRRSWIGFVAFTTTMSPFTSVPARRIVASVPRCLPRPDRAAADDDALADVEAPDDLHDLEPVTDVGPLLLGRRACAEDAGRGNDLVEVRRRQDDPDALGVELVGEAAQQRVVAELAADPRDRLERTRVRHDLAEEPRLRDTADHDGARHAERAERVDERLELTRLHHAIAWT